MQFILRIIVQGIAVFLTSQVLPGVRVDTYVTALIVAVWLAIVNAVLKPILFVLTLPITIVTLGLFTFVLNALMVLVVDAIVPGFAVGGFLNALFFSLVLSIIGTVLNWFTKK